MSITGLLHVEALGILYVLAATILFQIATGRIRVSGLIKQKDGTRQVSPARIQLLLASAAVGARYLTLAIRSTSGSVPDVGKIWLYLFGASCGIYLVEKVWVTCSLKSQT